MICLQYKLVKPFVIETFFNDVKLEGTSHLIVRPEKLSICKADMRYYFGQRDAAVMKKRLPMSLIHEACGRVMYDPTGKYNRGDKVVLLPNIPGTDDFYDENYRLDSLFRSSRADGFMQEALRIRHAQTVPYNEDMPDDIFSFTEFISVGVHAVNSFAKTAHSRREHIGVWGDGSLAYVVCCLLKSLYPETKITVIGLNPGKLQYFNFVNEVMTVNQVENTAVFDHAFECVGGAGSGAAAEQMIDTIHPQGTIMLLGVSEEPVPINTRMVLEKGLTLIGRSRSGREDFEKAVSIMQNDKFPDSPPEKIYHVRQAVLNSQLKNKIWLYTDHHAIGCDNAYYQFQHDWGKSDGILRYYICDGNMEEIKDKFTSEQSKFLIEYGSDFHKILYLKSEYIITSFSDIRPKIPFNNDTEFAYYRDLHQPTVIYLQHGVLHADLRWLQSAERCRTDKIVVSTEFERINLIQRYNYKPEDILPFGMPRYDHIDKNKASKNRIIFAPSWRSYLMKRNIDAVWEGNIGQLLKSRYLNKFISFLSSPELADFLEKNDLYLDAKLHPHMKSIVDLFKITTDRINITNESVNLEDYKLFITDISSYVFDFAYLSRPIIYFMPDMEEFESGMNHYRKLDLPFEDAFGNLVTEPEEVIEELKRVAGNGFVSDSIYKERMDHFFLPMENCEEKLYQYLMNNSI